MCKYLMYINSFIYIVKFLNIYIYILFSTILSIRLFLNMSTLKFLDTFSIYYFLKILYSLPSSFIMFVIDDIKIFSLVADTRT